MHEPPADVDVLIKDNLFLKAKLLLSQGKFCPSKGGSMLVFKCRHDNGTMFDLVQSGEFGMPIDHSSQIGGICVLDLFEILTSLLLRQEIRTKDKQAFATLIVGAGDRLTTDQKEKILARSSRMCKVASWEALVGWAKEFALKIPAK